MDNLTAITDNLDVARLRADIHDTVAEIRVVKAPLRRTWTRLMHEEQYRLSQLKLRATDLCILRAHARGRVHLARDPEYCHDRVLLLASDYQRDAVA